MRTFERCHLSAADPFTTKWKATVGDQPNVSIAQVAKEVSRAAPLCCQRCKAKNAWVLLAVGKLVVEEGVGGTEIEKVLCHDKDC